MEKNIYVISDLHGRGKAFYKMLEEISFGSEDYMYILGDVIDRGPDGIELLQYVKNQDNMELLMGNHEDMMVQTFFGKEEESWMETWMFNGGNTTLQGMGPLDMEVRSELLEYTKNLSIHKIIQVNGRRFLLIHAGVALEEKKSLEEVCSATSKDEALWIRREFFNSPVVLDDTIIFGHTPTGALTRYVSDMPVNEKKRCEDFKIATWKHRIDIDCGAAYGERLGCLRLNDMTEFYVDIEEEE